MRLDAVLVIRSGKKVGVLTSKLVKVRAMALRPVLRMRPYGEGASLVCPRSTRTAESAILVPLGWIPSPRSAGCDTEFESSGLLLPHRYYERRSVCRAPIQEGFRDTTVLGSLGGLVHSGA